MLNDKITDVAHKSIITWLHLIVLTGAVALIGLITYDTLRNMSFIADPFYRQCQFWICMVFMADIVIEGILAPKKWKYLCSNILFILVSIPYINLIEHYNVSLSGEMQYLIRFIPMLRAGYVLAIVLDAFSADRVSSLFMAYITLLASTLYFGSLMFFVAEHFVNPGVGTYWDALWWAFMDMTTAGSSINPVTPTGKVIGTILSAGGLILFPVFTVYIMRALTRTPSSSSDSNAS